MKLSDLEARRVHGRQYPDPRCNAASDNARVAGEPRGGRSPFTQEKTLARARREAARRRK